MIRQLVRKREESVVENDLFILKESFHRVSKRLHLLEQFIKTKFANEFKSTELGKSKTPFKPSAQNFAAILFTSGTGKSGNAGAEKPGNAGAEKPGNAGAEKSGNAGAEKSGNAGAEKSLTSIDTSAHQGMSGAGRRFRSSASKVQDSQQVNPSELNRKDDIIEDDHEMDSSGHFEDQDHQMDDTDPLTPSPIISEPEPSKKENVKEQGENSGDDESMESTHLPPPDSDYEVDEDKDESEEEEYVPHEAPWAEKVRQRRAEGTPHLRTDYSSFVYPLDRKCPICSKEFKESKHYKKNIRVHIQNHSKEKSFKCNKCERAYVDAKGLKFHTKHTHDKQLHAKFKCRFCDQTFVVESCRTKHEVIHSKKKAFVCSECGAAFTQHVSLKRHILVKHSKSSFDHLCAECGKRFFTAQNLKCHERLHEIKYDADGNKVRNKTCPFCPAAFYDNLNKQTHIQKVHGLKRKRKRKVTKGQKKPTKPRNRRKVEPDSETDQSILGLNSEAIVETTVVHDNNHFL